MQVLTSLILAAFVGYAGAWYLGMVEGNFALLLFWRPASPVSIGWPSVFTFCRSVKKLRKPWKQKRSSARLS